MIDTLGSYYFFTNLLQPVKVLSQLLMCFTESIPGCDVEQWNKDYMERSEEFYDALMNSNWEPLDTVDAPIPSMSWWLFLRRSVSRF